MKHDMEKIRAALRESASYIPYDIFRDAIDELEVLRAQVETLTQQLTAATNDAARAELRARELATALKACRNQLAEDAQRENEPDPEALTLAYHVLAASPDSDARLREVLERATYRGVVCGESRGSAGLYGEQGRENTTKLIVNKVLGSNPKNG